MRTENMRKMERSKLPRGKKGSGSSILRYEGTCGSKEGTMSHLYLRTISRLYIFIYRLTHLTFDS